MLACRIGACMAASQLGSRRAALPTCMGVTGRYSIWSAAGASSAGSGASSGLRLSELHRGACCLHGLAPQRHLHSDDGSSHLRHRARSLSARCFSHGGGDCVSSVGSSTAAWRSPAAATCGSGWCSIGGSSRGSSPCLIAHSSGVAASRRRCVSASAGPAASKRGLKAEAQAAEDEEAAAEVTDCIRAET